MPKPRTGTLIWRKSGWYGRLWTIIDGEAMRVCRALGTSNKAVARRKLDRLLASENIGAEDPKRPETFEEAAVRIYEARTIERPDDREPRAGLAQLRAFAIPVIGPMPITNVKTLDVNHMLDAAKAKGRRRQTVQHLKQHVSNVFAQLRREGAIVVNPATEAELPRYADELIKERAVLSDLELAIYLRWQHEEERFRGAVLERQTMACVSRMFGGVRTGDLHSLRWEVFDVENGGFEWGYAPRQKTRRPQLLEVPELLRPILRAWWNAAGAPREGVVFPVRRVGKRGDRVGLERSSGASHAAAFRRDLKSAFKNAIDHKVQGAPKDDSQRWRELFTETAYTRPVDFHSWRRAFAQALAEAEVNVQQAIALTGHSDPAVHARYLRNAGKLRRLPANALPSLALPERSLVKGTRPEITANHLGDDQQPDPKSDVLLLDGGQWTGLGSCHSTTELCPQSVAIVSVSRMKGQAWWWRCDGSMWSTRVRFEQAVQEPWLRDAGRARC